MRLIPVKDGKSRVPAAEVMTLTPTIARLIREGKIWEMTRFLEESEMFGMMSFNQSLSRLVKDGLVTEAEAMEYADSKDELILALRGIKK